ncbi:MAG: response regulator transcription factor [Gammaproteobacteria bacterium]|nr:response regulator transcription factor [Gammaproteobacteria bacterium]NIR85547.1 response regulator transcription factor [Gammaproteobacteria bacterium]NIR89806.1 response regulator transcription factor [Gammaproteobacteria bacterium]NIU06682.1 response regulator transcription factor [Gammaproteobacteria bacterium]NIV75073.1 response regulator [Gammaproteobacteria bacterium]
MRVLIADDEQPARERLAALLEELGTAQLVAQATNGVEVLQTLAQAAPEVVLLDIRMPGMDGLEVARHLARLEHPPGVIFTTAYDDHALAAFETNAVDYLLKPIRKARLAAALGRAQQLTRAQLAGLKGSRVGTQRSRTHISATMHGALQLVPVPEIVYLRAEDKYVVVRHTGGRLLIEESLVSLEQEFAERFLRVHRNALVAAAHVRELARNTDGGWEVRLRDIEESVAVSRRLAPGVRRALKGIPDQGQK